MDTILNMTVGQLLHKVTHHFAYILVLLSVVLNFEAIVRQVAVNRGYTRVVNLCDRVAGFITFILQVAEGVAKRNVAVPISAEEAKKVIPMILLCVGLVFASGCASAVYKSGCGHITGAEVTIPYVGGKANGNAYGCYMACAGNCKNADYTSIQKIMSDYVTTAAKDNTIKTLDGGTIVYNPPLK